MYPLYFSAVLKSADGKTLEEGEACLSLSPDAMDFNSEFVPLLRFGESATLVRVLGEQELESFPGRVYRCTAKSLRLTDIPMEAIDKAKRLFDVNEHIPISMALSPNGSADFPEEKASRIGGNLRYISPTLLRITALEQIPEGQIVRFSVQTPVIRLEQLAARVVRRVPLKRNASVLLCNILPPSIQNSRALERFTTSQGPQVRLL